MQKHTKITRERVEKFKDSNHLLLKRYEETAPVHVEHWAAPDRISFTQMKEQADFKEVTTGATLGKIWSTHWLKVSFTIPDGWKERGEIHFVFDCGGEGLIFDQNGIPYSALNGQTGADRREHCILPSTLHNGFYLECAANELFGNSTWKIGPTPPDESKVYTIKKICIALILPAFWQLYHDYDIISDIAIRQNEDSWHAANALQTANKMINLCDANDPSTYQRAIEVAKQYFEHSGKGSSGFHLSAIGHCHIDTAWLWPYAETKRKCARSWATQLRLMETTPEYKFACSQAQQFEWVRENYPELFSQIQEAVKKGNFIPIGGTWVEMDCNIPSGESLVRQFLYGQRFFKKYFDIYSPTFWLPDTFGYAAQLPQIIKQAGMKYFLTQKLSWNQINKFPHNTFIWEGIDGSKVLTHFPPADNYCSHANVSDILKSESNFKDKERSNEGLLVFGFGDGGGGPSPSMLENIKRVKNSIGGLPSIEFDSPNNFFDRLQEKLDQSDEDLLCTWTGELYFEYHRGTYTTQAKNKLYNRRSEDIMRELSFLSSLLFTYSKNKATGFDFSSFRETNEKLWKLILLNQFHDVIPGTSIHCVYEDSNEHYQYILSEAAKLRNSLIEQLSSFHSSSEDKKNPHWFLFNPFNFKRNHLLAFTAQESCSLPAELIQKIDDGSFLALIKSTPSPCGYSIISPDSFENTASIYPASIKETDGQGYELDNQFVHLQLDRIGQIKKLVWKETNRSVIKENQFGNHFVMFDDQPLFWDAWDVDVYHLEKKFEFHNEKNKNIKSEIQENGPLRVSVRVTIPISEQSTIEQIIYLNATSPLVEFKSKVHWFESNKFLKVQFPLKVLTNQVTYEIPYGYVTRPNHFNTSWDLARFEVCAHRFADISEYNFGVSLLNDCKYGYSCIGSLLSLSLLRSPKAPDETADMGVQEFSYALLPHSQTFQQASIIQEAYEFNNRLTPYPLSSQFGPLNQSFVHCDGEGVFIDQIKLAEDSNDIILRIYEGFGGTSVANIAIDATVNLVSASKVNVLEVEEEKIALTTPSSFKVNLSPFQILTVKLHFQ